jgi:uncharacterized protein YbbC (DUF1343 family)/CubicO group peptidase (beta-lactamase class C family)
LCYNFKMHRIPYRSPLALLRLVTAAVILAFLAGCAPALLPPAPPPVVVTPPPPPPPPAAGLPKVQDPRFARLSTVATHELAAGQVPGAVIFVGYQGKIVYHRALGQRTVEPYFQAMTEDTIFDLASLTKVVATTTAIMQLLDAGRVRLNDPVAKYWPEFAANGKSHITLRHLLTHTSGLRADVRSRPRWHDYQGAMAAIVADHPLNPPGTHFRYSDANFIILGEIVHRVSSLPLDVYCTREIFRPLGLKDTTFRPKASQKGRIAPTDLRWGKVHDPTAYRMGGVAGNAGVFSTADDLAVFVQMLLDGGVSRGRQILSPAAVAAMTKPCRLPGNANRRGLGWDICSPYSRVFNGAFPMGSFGHTGYTGTSIWADPKSKTFLIILTNRLHPHGRGQVKALRARISAAVAQVIHLGKPARAALGGAEPVMAGHGASDRPDKVRSGLEVLVASGFAPLKGKNIGVITNHTGVDAARRSTLRLLLQAPGVKVRAIFSPEHGLSGKLDEKIASGRDGATGLPVYSLYGKTMRPTARMLQGLDALVYDIQDVGARYYTYITTMAYAMEAAAGAGLDFYVLDRPDPLTAASVQGPVLDPDLHSFIGYFPLPVRYGMTPGEMAQLFNRERHIGARLQVVKMKGYERGAWFDETGLPWVNPSPNIRSLAQAILYAGVGLVESANVSVGRGTAMPFEVVGAPWISGSRLARYLSRRHLAGVTFEPVTFVPTSDRFHGRSCGGVRLRLEDRDALDAPALGIELAAALYHLYPGQFQIHRTLSMIGSRRVLQEIKNGTDPRNIKERWQAGLEAFRRVRAKYLLY